MASLEELRPGTFVNGPALPEMIEVIALIVVTDSIRILGRGTASGRVLDTSLEREALPGLSIVEPPSQRDESRVSKIRQGLEEIERGAARIILTAQKLRMPRGQRILRGVQLATKHLVEGSVTAKVEGIRRALGRAIGREEPLDEFNPSTPIISEARRIETMARGAQLEIESFRTTQASSTPEPSSDTPVPYCGIRAPHGRRKVAILTNMLLDWSDLRPRYGGGERYALLLGRLLRALGLEVHFFQGASREAEGEYHGFPVRTIVPTDGFAEFHPGVCTRFTELARSYDHVLHHLPEYTTGIVRDDAILVCHGVWFDHDNFSWACLRTPRWYEHLARSFRSPRRIVSVDTNFINFVRASWPSLAAKMTFIPNTFDPAQFRPDPSKRQQGQLTVLFPRRAYVNRGSRLVEGILRLVPNDVRFCWVGEGEPEDESLFCRLAERDPRFTFQHASFDEMPLWYQRADITVIPTVACEGTSYSAIEALASGSAVVATRVGGLPDVVHDGLNGLVVPPTERAIAEAIRRLIEDHAERARLQLAGPPSVVPLSLEKWRARWTDVLADEGWIAMAAAAAAPPLDPLAGKRIGIFTRNAIHGGVETMIAVESQGLDAPVVVTGGWDRRENCPFPYTRADSYDEVREALAGFDVILYHWLPDWAVDAVRDSGIACAEFVHRTDTAESDKSLPDVLLVHSAFLAEFLWSSVRRRSEIVEHPIDVTRHRPGDRPGEWIGGMTSYYDTKGLDIFLHAWKEIGPAFSKIPVKFFGEGESQGRLVALAKELGIEAEFAPAIPHPWEVLPRYRCFVVPSRIEGLPLTVLEALAANVPVVASDLPGIVELNRLGVRRGYPQLVTTFERENPTDLGRVLKSVLRDETPRKTRPYIEEFHGTKLHVDRVRQALGLALLNRSARVGRR